MVHVPSFLVGGLFSGGAFLLLHEQVSHRQKLSHKWIIRELAEKKWKDIKTQSSKPEAGSTSQFQPPKLEQEWNKALGKLQDAMKRDP
ncbi:expressed unknown protein [Seminavis robusta]|uniref:Uncharacterized protein n=1 Tax=Seminavis robusta TaxID=568900 RepID=A0A9N8ELZ5_9STRA|nr:expressed unknown protein [Seminavis robusta]|eukprot:Sro1338_g264210.1 n/a (88) ;mRNA; f:9094-9529